MRIDLAGRTILQIGDRDPVSEAVSIALAADGAHPMAAAAEHPDILVATLPLLPTPNVTGIGETMATLTAVAAEMAAGRGGRIVLVLSALAALPARRHPDYSVAMAGALASLRSVAMARGPAVLANAVGVGAVGEPLVAGDAAFVGHTGLGRAGSVADVVAAVKFLCDPMNTYTTGQLLCVDGGWSAGYGRSF